MLLPVKPPVTMALELCPFSGRYRGCALMTKDIVNQGIAAIVPGSQHPTSHKQHMGKLLLVDITRNTLSRMPSLSIFETGCEPFSTGQRGSGGRSRQGAPLLAIQSMALNIMRLSLAGLPGFPVRTGGKRAEICSYCWSVSSYRFGIMPLFLLFYHEIGDQNSCFVQFLIFGHVCSYSVNRNFPMNAKTQPIVSKRRFMQGGPCVLLCPCQESLKYLY